MILVNGVPYTLIGDHPLLSSGRIYSNWVYLALYSWWRRQLFVANCNTILFVIGRTKHKMDTYVVWGGLLYAGETATFIVKTPSPQQTTPDLSQSQKKAATLMMAELWTMTAASSNQCLQWRGYIISLDICYIDITIVWKYGASVSGVSVRFQFKKVHLKFYSQKMDM